MDVPESLEAFLDRPAAPERSLVAVDVAGSAVEQFLAASFADLPVDVDAATRGASGSGGDTGTVAEAYSEGTIALVEDGAVVATSPLGAVMDGFLLVNSDRYRTGEHGLERPELPAVLSNLDGTVFEVRGYPHSHSGKLLLVLVSRYVEGLAWRRGRGRLRASFQHLGRVDDERGTRAVYERLGERGLDVHVYGRPADPVPDLGEVTVHAGTGPEYRRSWCVVYVPEDPAAPHAALVALETGDNAWRGTWRFDAEWVRGVDAYVRERF